MDQMKILFIQSSSAKQKFWKETLVEESILAVNGKYEFDYPDNYVTLNILWTFWLSGFYLKTSGFLLKSSSTNVKLLNGISMEEFRFIGVEK